MGFARWDERRRSVRVAHIRRSPCPRRWLRDPDRDALPPGDMFDGGGHPGCARAAAEFAEPQPDGGRYVGGGYDRVPVAGPRTDLPPVPGSCEQSGPLGMPRAGEGDTDDLARAAGDRAAL